MDDAVDDNRRARDPKKKYMEMLQEVADRRLDEVCIELDDLDAVGDLNALIPWTTTSADCIISVRKELRGR